MPKIDTSSLMSTINENKEVNFPLDARKKLKEMEKRKEKRLEHESLPLFPEKKAQKEPSKPSELKKDVKPRGRPRKSSEKVKWRRDDQSRTFSKIDVCDLPPQEKKILNEIVMYSFNKSTGERLGDFFVLEMRISELHIGSIKPRTIRTYLTRLKEREMISWSTKDGKYSTRKFKIPWDIYIQTDVGRLRNLL